MNLLRLSNTFNRLVRQSTFFQSYHAGYHSDINLNTPGVDNGFGQVGKAYPHVLWAMPVDGALDMRNSIDKIDVTLYFYNLQDYQNDGLPVDPTSTLLFQWNELKARAVEFMHGFNKGRTFKVMDGAAKYFTDSNANVDRLICVGVEFTVVSPYACADYDNQNPPLEADNNAPGEYDMEVENAV